jgi:hypothetical protein
MGLLICPEQLVHLAEVWFSVLSLVEGSGIVQLWSREEKAPADVVTSLGSDPNAFDRVKCHGV